jgi:hypothetical protein
MDKVLYERLLNNQVAILERLTSLEQKLTMGTDTLKPQKRHRKKTDPILRQIDNELKKYLL